MFAEWCMELEAAATLASSGNMAGATERALHVLNTEEFAAVAYYGCNLRFADNVARSEHWETALADPETDITKLDLKYSAASLALLVHRVRAAAVVALLLLTVGCSAWFLPKHHPILLCRSIPVSCPTWKRCPSAAGPTLSTRRTMTCGWPA